jgi:hypothetical protein
MQRKISKILEASNSAVIGTDGFDHEVMKSLSKYSSRKDLIEAIITRAEALDTGVEFSYYRSHLFLKWEGTEADTTTTVTIQIALRNGQEVKSVISAIKNRPGPLPSEAVLVPSTPLKPIR